MSLLAPPTLQRTDDEITERHANRDASRVSIGDRIPRTTRVSLTVRHVPLAAVGSTADEKRHP